MCTWNDRVGYAMPIFSWVMALSHRSWRCQRGSVSVCRPSSVNTLEASGSLLSLGLEKLSNDSQLSSELDKT